MDDSLARYGPWALIAGGSEGVGASFAHHLAAAGINLVLVARRADPLRETAEACRASGVEVRTLAVDLADRGAAALVAGAVDDLDIGLLVYNAGANTHSARFLDGDLAAFDRVIDLNVTTPLGLVHRLTPGMVARGRGGVILVGSMAGYLGSSQHTVYGGVKAFGRIFAEGLWLELREHGVDVLELVLGVTRTPAMRRAGLNFDVPGLPVAEPDQVAVEGLRALPHGPVHIVSGNERLVTARNDADRARAVLGAHRAMQRLIGATADDGS
ncbi:SDR family NAD(P)-dependent oxidoreductase [Nocardia sp. bgisy134]|uniref:SDR family NAD(P)-dependent oxidoreductase n=1 Tax=Nocardia sp. bgisy134 TaxID=3413789 RepID=UPI003D752D3F